MSPSYQSIITLESGKRSGKPTIRDLRITVFADLPYLTEADIQACLSYAAE